MSSEVEKYDLVFRGDLAKGVEQAVAKRNLAQLFKIDAVKVDALFSGKAVVLKRNLSLDAASKYRVAIKKAGALVELSQQQARKVKPQGRATFAVPESPAGSAEMGAIPGTESVAADADAVAAKADAQGFELAPPGVYLLAVGEQKIVEAVDIDISGLSLRENDGNLLSDDEYVRDVAADFDLPEIDLAEAGADVLRPEERKIVEAVAVDLSGMSLASPGEKLAPEKPAPPPPPDISGITLKE
ncbi:hypothetical protein [Teredinibacter haidensis]|uniref:hypothetical protein n=1 Tax=Teredinibacter haidensis TaxID=2731755 RepID=UPI000948FF77|nr:hypothetical protein [Teredinibacter haidensis]